MIVTHTIKGKTFKAFSDCLFTMNGGQEYKIISTEKRYKLHYHTVKNSKGELREFEHNELIQLVEDNP